ncbi:aldehyde dehydrogenase EutE [Pectobacterium parmentieri]|uniref:Aldehyde dehydrogenase EutE n=2 Tax=Pectobacterium TaxID=122277 RepID=A0A0H3IB47_PECPM|nr:aldehyde dehydrogenase family protein [Pectobacterium parmentieri]ACX89823.1 Aldehyde Dehydrogenase [Pectobacterium parmentieri WPP163]AFI92310.1 Ethanolamine utilization protein EutE [Pectobacterium parmentieri]AOR61338.1 aldehyde dehydrogenase EutE [Pectobacterium parmentieri]AYH03205.1 aldehyde dehydrogenase EutE [Pectobacterium parmentieri]AYH07534.1 aldehyde dehydrogenase EutE [Pectobacterium parmentieri]
MNDLEITQAVSRALSKYTKTTPEAQEHSGPSATPAPDRDNIEAIVASALARRAGAEPAADQTSGNGAFATMDEAIAAAQHAQIQYRHCSMQDRTRFVDGIRQLFLQEEVLQAISRMAVEETGMGNYADKLVKNRVAAQKTPGVEDLATSALSGDGGLTLMEYSAYGVIGSITPTTNPTETIINNSIGMLAAGNTAVFSPHPRSRNVSLHCVALINQQLARLGAPANLVVTVTKPSIDNTNALINDPRVNMLVATGGPAIVKTVMSSGKKAIGAGAGNPPAVVDETANVEKAARDIINGCSFDNNLPCVAEKEVIVVNEVADYLIHCMKKSGAWLLCDKQHIQQLQSLVLNEKGTGPNTAFVGKNARFILQQIGINVPEEIKVILIEAERDHPFVVHELMMPILPVVRVENVDEAIELAVKVEHGNRHTAMMHSTNVEKLTKMARLIQTTIFVKNGPSYAGIGVGGEGHATFTIAGPTGEGLTSARTFARNRRCVMVEALNIR